MKILIVSDSHRKLANLATVIDHEKDIDVFIHLGDVEGDEDTIISLLDEKVKYYFICGNNDFFSDLSREMEIELKGKRCLLTHGHYYYVSLDLSTLKDEVKSRNFDIVMFGHTHRPTYEEIDGHIILNPGSVSYPRQNDGLHTYGIMEISDSGEIKYQLKCVENIK